jgi:cell wall-associated NlpC family hydrolase
VSLRALKRGRRRVPAIAAVACTALGIVAAPAVAASGTGGAGAVGYPVPTSPPALAPAPGTGGGVPVGGVPATTPLPTAQLSADGRTASAPASAPDAVKGAIYAANQLTRKPYRYGGGHRSFLDRAYDCSGSVSYALHGGGILGAPLDSTSFMRWGLRGKGTWITVYANRGHAFVVIAGLRFDTSGPGQRGPRWRLDARASRGFKARHPLGF